MPKLRDKTLESKAASVGLEFKLSACSGNMLKRELLRSASLNKFCRIPPVGGDILVKMTSDLDLLRRFARENSQDAFTELVRRHVNLVYSAALRQVRSPQLAEEIAQSVFADLARVAATPSSPLSGCDASSQTILTPWLYAVTRRTAIDVIRKESRRQLREQIAVEMNDMNATSQ